MNVFASVLSWLGDGYWPTAEEHDDLSIRLGDARRRYRPQRLLTAGDAADLHVAADESETRFLLKVARGPEGNAHLNVERQTLATLCRAAGDGTYRDYLPALVDSFSTTGRLPRRINVFRWAPGLRTLEQVHQQHPALDGRHLAWIFNRLLTVLGFCSRQRIVHGAVLPCHVLIDAANHGLRLVGWGHSVSTGRRLGTTPDRYRDWYPAEARRHRQVGPATDLFLAARCVVYLAGGDPLCDRMPDAMPRPMRRFFRTCLLESPSMRPGDAWALMDDFDKLLRALYGPAKFHHLSLT